jgi:hypothetical protein
MKALAATQHAGSDAAVQRAIGFLSSTRDVRQGNWYGEPFETMLVLDTVADVAPRLLAEWSPPAVNWLLSLQRGNGVVVAAHYTAMFASLLFRLAIHRGAAQKAVRWLQRDLREKDAWTSAAWSNAYCLGALLDAGEDAASPSLGKAIEWFLTHQSDSGAWEQVARLDDTAMAVLVMSRLLTAPLVHLAAPKVGVVRVNRENGTIRFAFEVDGETPIVQSERFKIADDARSEITAQQTYLVALGGELRGSGLPTQDVLAKLMQIGRYAQGHLVPPKTRAVLLDAGVDHLRMDIDERLIDLPWELLYDGEDFACLRYAVGRRLISEHASAAAPRRTKNALRVLVIADPTCDLPNARLEGEAVAARLRAASNITVDLFTGDELRKHEFLLRINEYDVVHFAGHAIHDVSQPDESSLVFADGSTTAFELARFVRDTPPALVFLNACWSATETHVSNYPAMMRGLGRTLLYAGVGAFIGYLIPVRDASAIELATYFYDELLLGHTVGESLRLARLTLIDRLRDPRDVTWASVVLYGDPARDLRSY